MMAAILGAGISGLLIAVLIGAFSSAVGSDLHGWALRLAKHLNKTSAKWLPIDQRRDFEEEHDEWIECYSEDGLKITALVRSLFEFGRNLCQFALPVWLVHERGAQIAGAVLAGVSSGLIGSLWVEILPGWILGLVGGLIGGVRTRWLGLVISGLSGAVLASIAGSLIGTPLTYLNEAALDLAFRFEPNLLSMRFQLWELITMTVVVGTIALWVVAAAAAPTAGRRAANRVRTSIWRNP